MNAMSRPLLEPAYSARPCQPGADHPCVRQIRLSPSQEFRRNMSLTNCSMVKSLVPLRSLTVSHAQP